VSRDFELDRNVGCEELTVPYGANLLVADICNHCVYVTLMNVSVYAVDVVLFCALTKLQLQLYRALLQSRAVTSCLRSFDSAQHLRCISALKKLCNHAQLLRAVSMEMSSTCGDPEVFSVISVPLVF